MRSQKEETLEGKLGAMVKERNRNKPAPPNVEINAKRRLRASANASHLVDGERTGDLMCYVFDEHHGDFIPWTANSVLKLKRGT